MNTIKSIQRLSEEELRQGIPESASWHADYSSSAYVHVGGLPYGMNEGDVITVFSQVGEIVDCNLVRDHDSGESKGFAFIAYADQRSTVLAVDNFNAAVVCGRVIKVDHVTKYKIPKEYLQGKDELLYNPTGPDGCGWGEFKNLSEVQLEKHNSSLNDAEKIWEKQLMREVHQKAKKHRPKHHSHEKKHKKHRKNKHGNDFEIEIEHKKLKPTNL
jgi:RNA-binding motif protein, X-linked 2